MKSIWLDSNIFLRELHSDLPKQHQRAHTIFKQIEQGNLKGLVSLLVVEEVLWVLENFYRLKRSDFSDKVLKLILLKNIKLVELPKRKVVKLIKTWEEKSADLTDVYLALSSRETNLPVASFDRDFDKLGVK